MNDLPKFIHCVRNERQGNERHHRQRPVLDEHERQRHRERHERIGWIHDAGAESIADSRDVVGRMRHQIPGRRILEIAEREFLDVGEKVVPQIVFDLAGNDDNSLPCQECHEPGDDGKSDDEPGVQEQTAVMKLSRFEPMLDRVHGIPDEEGHGHHEQIADDNGANTPGKRLLVLGKIGAEAKQ